ncbi:hypothetical protein JCM21900_000946 [Sporobolomyces salmonicolor]
MLLHPRHPDPLFVSSSSRPPLPLSRSASSTGLARAPQHRLPSARPLQPVQAPLAPSVRDPSPPAPMNKPVPNPAPAATAQQPPAAPPPEKKDDKGKDRAKLTQQWGAPPEQIRREGHWLQRGQLLGEGGFARVYLCTEPDGITNKALKVIDKQQLKSTKTKSKLFAEIKIHQAMQHPNIIAFEHCFEDEGNVYMQLELCSNGSLLDLLRRRRRYSEPEARYYLTQLVGACDYMHSNSVIHRDLKLGNLMLDDNMDLRVGDFGLAALVKFPGERKKTICGTPNYIAPEILFDTKGGHSFEVDIWSIGVILYTLLIGKPPFQTKDVKNIYRKIRDNAYTFPPEIPLSAEAQDLISWILRPVPSERPTLAEILAHPFLITGPFPSRISPRASEAEGARECVEEWRYMTKRQARENFRRVKRKAGIVEVDDGQEGVAQMGASGGVRREMVSQALPAVAEAVQEEQSQDQAEEAARQGARMVRVRGGRDEEREAKGRVEKEVKVATAPDSPISELLRSARKPLMVSPSAATTVASRRSALPSEQPLQRQLAAASGSSGSAAAPREREKENAPPLPSTATDPGTPRSRHRRGAAQTQLDVQGVVPPAAPIVTTSHPSRNLYESTWRLFDAYLSAPSASALPVDPGAEAEAVEQPRVFITSWVDYTHKYGTAYSLTDGTAGLYFNDTTTLVLSPDKEHFDFVSHRKSSKYERRHYALSSVPAELERKAYLLRYFEDYMAKTLRRDVAWTFEDVERVKNMDFLLKYYRMKNAIVFKMSNEVLQFNFYDHTKLIITSSGRTLTFIDPSFVLTTHSLASLFADAASLGHYSTTAPADARQREQLEHARFLLSKVEYCRDVLRTLSHRKVQAMDKAREKEQQRA